MPKKPNPAYATPEPPKSLNPLALHGYYMAMSDHHDRHSQKHARLRDLQSLWSGSRAYHDDRSNFHKSLRDGYAQKALSIDLQQEQQSPGMQRMRESIDEGFFDDEGTSHREMKGIYKVLKAQGYRGGGKTSSLQRFWDKGFDPQPPGAEYPTSSDSHRIYTNRLTGEWSSHGLDHPYGQSPKEFKGKGAASLAAHLKGFKYERPAGYWDAFNAEMDRKYLNRSRASEAFSGISPTGAMNTINANKPPSPKVLNPKPFSRSSTAGTAAPSKTPFQVSKANEAVSEGANPFAVLRSLMA